MAVTQGGMQPGSNTDLEDGVKATLLRQIRIVQG